MSKNSLICRVFSAFLAPFIAEFRCFCAVFSSFLSNLSSKRAFFLDLPLRIALNYSYALSLTQQWIQAILHDFG